MSFELAFVSGPGSQSNGDAIRRRVALRIDGEDRDVVKLALDSSQARSRQARAWAKDFQLPEAEVIEKLRKASITATEEAQAAKSGQNVRGAESPPHPPITTEEAKPIFSRWLAAVDHDQLEVVFGAVMANGLDGDPVWVFIIGAPGDMKTELLRSLSKHRGIFMVSTLTPAALISGYETDGEDPSLLPKLDGKVLLVKDFTAILEMPQEARGEVLGTLRDAYDGEAGKTFGTGQTRSYKSRFGLIAAVTPAIDSYWSVGAQLGERFLRFRLRGQGRTEKARQAMTNTNDETAMRADLSAAALGVLAQNAAVPVVPDEIEEKLIALADFVSLTRSSVARDKKGVVQYIPAPEMGTRVGKALKKLAMGITMARGLSVVTDDVYRIIQRVGVDCIPSMRARLLEVLWRNRAGYVKGSIIADEAEIPADTAKTWLDDLRLLGIVDRGGDQRSGYTWTLRDDFQDTVAAAGLWQSDGLLCDRGGAPPDSAPLTGNEDLQEVTDFIESKDSEGELDYGPHDDADETAIAASRAAEADV